MTAIYAFTAKDKGLGFIAADDLDSEGKKVDKIALIDKRYAVTCHGKGIVVKAAQYIESFEIYNNCDTLGSIENVINEIFQITKILCEKLFPVYQKERDEGKLSEKEWVNDVLAASVVMIILDGVSKQLYQVTQNNLFPPDKIDLNPKITSLDDNKLHLFSFAEFANLKSSLPLTEDILLNPIGYIGEKIVADKMKEPKIGNLGTYVLCNGEKIEISTCFESAKDYVFNMISDKCE
ncbi:MAG: hypothetical protein M0Q01_01000 [Syntrophales bacterium]|jgi:hypothetical protein|nr:hypothetical protein [Syntrophales bacterium]